MITLNTNRQLLRIESWDQIECIPGFRRDLDAEKMTLDSIIGSYQFKDFQKCGLASCKQPHGKGYIVTTKEGFVTNIGKDCGKRYFSVEFTSLRKTFDKEIRYQEQREVLQLLQARRDEVAEKIQRVRTANPFGADVVQRFLSKIVTPSDEVPGSIVDQLRRMVRTRDPVIRISRIATSEEVDQIEVATGKKLPRPYFLSESVGRIDGIEALYEENSLRRALIVDVEQPLKELSDVDIASLNARDRSRFAKFALEIDTKLEMVEGLLQTAVRFLKVDNLRKLELLLDKPDEKKHWGRFLQRLPPT